MIWLNYPVFKTFVTDDVCDKLTNYLIELLKYGKKYYNKVDIKVNLDGLTITGLERYKKVVEYCMNRLSDKYDSIIETCILINAPSFTGQLISLFSNIIGQSRFSRLPTKLVVISKK